MESEHQLPLSHKPRVSSSDIPQKRASRFSNKESTDIERSRPPMLKGKEAFIILVKTDLALDLFHCLRPLLNSGSDRVSFLPHTTFFTLDSV